MNGKQTAERKTVAPTIRTRCGAAFLGVDEEEYAHVLLRDRREVVRLDEDSIERTIDLGDASDVAYREWVKGEIGWETRDTILTVKMHKALGGT